MIQHMLDYVRHNICGIMLYHSADTQFILTYLLHSNVPDTYAECAIGNLPRLIIIVATNSTPMLPLAAMRSEVCMVMRIHIMRDLRFSQQRLRRLSSIEM